MICLIRVIGLIVPRRLRADWRREWEAELHYRETLLAEWDKLDWRAKLALLWHSLGAFADALWLQPKRLEDEMFRDLRFGWRMLMRRKSFTLVVVMSLALGMGANTALFSIVDSILLRPLPYRDSERLVKIMEANPQRGLDRLLVSLADFYNWKSQARSFEGMAALARANYRVTGGEAPEDVSGNRVSVNFFSLLGAEAAIGRIFLPDDEKIEGGGITVLSHNYWVARFNADPNVIGRAILLNGNPHVIVGVLPASFRETFDSLPGRAQIWTPAVLTPETAAYRGPGRHGHGDGHIVIARLKPRVTLEQARVEMAAIAGRLAQAYPQSNREIAASVYSLRDEVTRSSQKNLLMLLAAFGLVLLVACANVGSLLLARGIERAKEVAVRAAIGAGRWRMMRQLLTECVLLSSLGGALGFLIARWIVAGVTPLIPRDVPRTDEIALDHRALLFTLALTLLTTLLFSLLPAWQTAKVNLTEVLKEAGRTSSESRLNRWRRHSLVICQIALTMILLVGAGLMTNSLIRHYRVRLGFDARNLLTLGVRPPLSAKETSGQWDTFWNPLLERAASLPGIQGAAIASTSPMDGGYLQMDIGISSGVTAGANESMALPCDIVSRDYFRLLGVTLIRGRHFTDDDRADTTPSVIINESLARAYFPGQEPIGQPAVLLRGTKYEKTARIVGVVADSRTSLDRETRPHFYLLASQFSALTKVSMILIARTESRPVNYFGAMRSLAISFNPTEPVGEPITMEEILARHTVRPRFYLSLLGGVAALALALAGAGVYGVLSLSVIQRTHEIGIRRALGAQDVDVLMLVIRQGMTLALTGLAAGVIGALALTRYIRGWLYEVSATDPITFSAGAVLFMLVTMSACYAPARRAVKVDPMVALRRE